MKITYSWCSIWGHNNAVRRWQVVAGVFIPTRKVCVVCGQINNQS